MTRAIHIYKYGGPEVLTFEQVEVLPPDAGEVSIEVKAIGLNRSEAVFRSGRHIEAATFPARLGYEAAGIVQAVGDEVQHIRIGDAVSLIPPPSVTRWGTYADVVTVPAEFVVKHPSSLSWSEAAAIWMANVTAYGGLIDIANLCAGEAALILAASSSVGLASIQIVNAIGAVSIATTRSQSKRQALLDAGAQQVIVTQDEDLTERVFEITGGSGVRVVFDPVAGTGVPVLLGVMAQHGIVIAYGSLEDEPPQIPISVMISKGLTYRGYTFKEIVLNTSRREQAKAFILAGLDSGLIRPVIDKTFRFEDIAEGHRYLESNQQFGKIVVTV